MSPDDTIAHLRAQIRRCIAERHALLNALIELKRDALPYLWESDSFKRAHDVLKSLQP